MDRGIRAHERGIEFEKEIERERKSESERE